MPKKTKCTKVTIKPGSSVTVSPYSNPKQDCSVTYGQHYVPKMPEYIEREEAIQFVNQNICHFGGETTLKCVEICLEAVPAADVVEVVRCKDCEHITEKGICQKFRQRYPFYPEDDFHCGFGKRKEGAENG